MRTTTIGLAAALALTLAACSDTSDDADLPQETTAPAESDEPTSEAPETDAGASPDRSIDIRGHEFAVTLEEALEKSRAETGDGIIHSVGMDWWLDGTAGAWVWEVDTIANGEEWELDIDATSGEIRQTERSGTDDDEKALDFEAIIDYEVAMASAEASGRVTGWDLEWDDGRMVYSIEFEDDIDVTVDATTGDVVEVDD